MRTSRLLVVLVGCCLIARCNQQGCSPWPQIFSALADDDKDGWFTAANNNAITLSLVSGVFTLPGNYEFLVDEVRFPLAANLKGRFPVALTQIGSTVSLAIPAVATRVRGVQGFGATGTPFSAVVRVVVHDPITDTGIILGTATVAFGETAGTLPTVTIGGVALTFSVTATAFADPNPNNASGDADADGIPENREAQFATRFRGIGDPRPGGRDIIVIIGVTDPTFELTTWAREDLRSRFRLNGFTLHLDTGTLNGATGEGGLMNLSGTGVTPTTPTTAAQARTVRDANVPGWIRANSYFALLTNLVSIPGLGTTFGTSEGIPGSSMAMRVGFAGINNIAWYHAGLFMHELGHLLRLCHPTDHTGLAGACPPIPVPQRNPALTVMGSPAEDPNIVVATVNALARPLDYAPAQWPLVAPGAGFTP